jgi:translation initiation factor 2B subunit (eIF-2B alpha/beta/delta family)
MAAVWNAAHAGEPERFLEELELRRRRAVRHARQLLRGTRLVVTLSYSSSVLETLSGLDAAVVVGQSLPGGEGKRTAAVLKQRGIEVRMVPDATLPSWIPAADAVLLGADAVTRRGAVNKTGSRALALVARVERCPCYVVADTTKFPRGPNPFPPPLLGPGAWFEYVELPLLDRVITEAGALTPRVIGRLVRIG